MRRQKFSNRKAERNYQDDGCEQERRVDCDRPDVARPCEQRRIPPSIKDKKAMTVANELWDRWICVFGMPERLLSDNGGEFTGEEMCKALNPRANGQVERFNKTLANMLAKKVASEEQTAWDSYAATVCMSYNTTKHSATGETPHMLMFGEEPKTSLDEIRIGDLVWVRQEPITDVDKQEHKKLKLPWSGPFVICQTDHEKYGNS